MEVVVENKYSDLIINLENSELDNQITDPSFYMKLLALYLYENNLKCAEFLWRRIPADMKASNKDLGKLGCLMQSLRRNNSMEFFKNINYDWPDCIKDIMRDLEEKTRMEFFNLVEKSYSSILESNLMDFTQLTRNHLRMICQQLKWTLDIVGQDVFIEPKINPKSPAEPCNSETGLFTLTEFVTFLEN